jgi:hypothetical protein
MTLTVDDIIKFILTFSVCFSLVGISVQFMRMLGNLTDTVKEMNFIVKDGRSLLEKFLEDYDYIIEQIKSILEAVSSFTQAFFLPLSNIFGFLKKFEGFTNFGKGRSKSAHHARNERTDEGAQEESFEE